MRASVNDARLHYIEGTEDVWSRQGRRAEDSVEQVRERRRAAGDNIAGIVDKLASNSN